MNNIHEHVYYTIGVCRAGNRGKQGANGRRMGLYRLVWGGMVEKWARAGGAYIGHFARMSEAIRRIMQGIGWASVQG